MLQFVANSDDPSSTPAKVYSFSVKLYEKETGYGQFTCISTKSGFSPVPNTNYVTVVNLLSE